MVLSIGLEEVNFLLLLLHYVDDFLGIEPLLDAIDTEASLNKRLIFIYGRQHGLSMKIFSCIFGANLGFASVWLKA